MRDARVKEKYNIFLPLTHSQWGTTTFETSECVAKGFLCKKLSSAPSATCGSGSAVGYGGTYLHDSILDFSQSHCLSLSQLVAPRSPSYASVLLILFPFPPAPLLMGSQLQFLHRAPISTQQFSPCLNPFTPSKVSGNSCQTRTFMWPPPAVWDSQAAKKLNMLLETTSRKQFNHHWHKENIARICNIL